MPEANLRDVCREAAIAQFLLLLKRCKIRRTHAISILFPVIERKPTHSRED